MQKIQLALLFALILCSQARAQTHVVKLSKAEGASAAASEPHAISPYIYGFGSYLHEDRTKENVWELRPTLYRFGGNTSTRYNYLNNSWNTAQDWFFHNYSGGKDNIVDAFMSENQRRGVASAITVPMLGWVAKDGSSMSFPRASFPKQDGFDGDAGNGLLGGKKLKADPLATSVPITSDYVYTYVSKLKTKFGPYPHFYIMDNEPMLWSQTHRDVQAEPVSYDSYLKRYIEFASAVRRADPKAVIIGPALWGWMAMNYSAFDAEGPWNAFKRGADRAAHGDKPFLEWFLEKLSQEEKKQKMSLLDIIDVHHYPETGKWPSGPESGAAFRNQLLRSTRSLWDKTYTDESWIDEKIYFIPRLRAMAARFKPSAKVSIGEYNYRSERDAAGAIAQADILGIMASEDLYAAQYWDFPLAEGTHRNAFLLFRNFDGKGGAFGDRFLPNTVGNQATHSVYVAEDKAGKRLTIVMINKSLTNAQTFDLQIGSYGKPKAAKIVGFRQAAKPNEMQRYEAFIKDLSETKVKTEPLSMQILELRY
ncbi:MAG: glycoside hydrolase family 44 protein [Bdellovibrionota bacterium]